MKSILIIPILIAAQVYGQESPVAKLAFNDQFITWVDHLTTNQWEVYREIRDQLGLRTEEFYKAASLVGTNEQTDELINAYGLNPDRTEDLMAEHLGHALLFAQNHPEVWALPQEERMEFIKKGYYLGFNSSDPRWLMIRSKLTAIAFQHCGSTARITPSEIADCFWETIRAVLSVSAPFNDLISAVNSGSWSQIISAIKKVLKTTLRRIGWLGLAVQAIDLAFCLLGADED